MRSTDETTEYYGIEQSVTIDPGGSGQLSEIARSMHARLYPTVYGSRCSILYAVGQIVLVVLCVVMSEIFE